LETDIYLKVGCHFLAKVMPNFLYNSLGY